MSSLSVQNANMKAADTMDQPAAKKGRTMLEAEIELPSSVFVELTSKQDGELMSVEGDSTLYIPSSTTPEQLAQLANTLLKVSDTFYTILRTLSVAILPPVLLVVFPSDLSHSYFYLIFLF